MVFLTFPLVKLCPFPFPNIIIKNFFYGQNLIHSFTPYKPSIPLSNSITCLKILTVLYMQTSFVSQINFLMIELFIHYFFSLFTVTAASIQSFIIHPSSTF